MSADDNPAGAEGTAETAELRKARADRPESEQVRGLASGKVSAENCGKTAEEVRNLSFTSVSAPALPLPLPSGRAPDLVHVSLPKIGAKLPRLNPLNPRATARATTELSA